MKVAPALVAVAMVTVLFGSYLVYADLTRPETELRTVPILSYAVDGNFTYVATLDPNPLYDGTTLRSGEGVLFTTFTRWINVTFRYSISFDRAADVRVVEAAEVGISGSAWYRPVSTESNDTSAAGVEGHTVVREFALDVQALLAQMRAIDNATKTSASQHAILIHTAVTAIVQVSGQTVPVHLSPVLYLNVTSTRIVPGPMDALASEAVTTSVSVVAPPPGVPLYLAVLVLAGSLGFLGAAGLALRRSRRRDAVEDLDEMMRPYLEAIADTATPPEALATVEMASWDDLVKVADTLGKPILRSREGNPEPRDARFFVLDGETCYGYRYVPAEGNGPDAAAATRNPEAQVRQAEILVRRLRLLARDGEDVRPYCRRMRRALHLLSRGNWKKAHSLLRSVEDRIEAAEAGFA